MKARREDILRAWRRAERLQVDPGAPSEYRAGWQLVDRLQALAVTRPVYAGGPMRNLSRGWAAYHLAQAADMRREFVRQPDPMWRWRLEHVRANVAHAHSCNRTADYRGLPQ